jgi:hypothetical protein
MEASAAAEAIISASVENIGKASLFLKKQFNFHRVNHSLLHEYSEV